MNNFSEWKKNRKKNNPKLSYSEIISKGGRLRWYDRECPEWLWMAVFICVIVVMALVMTNKAKIEPVTSDRPIGEQIVAEQAKTQLDGKMTATGVASWYDYSLDGIEWSKDHDTCATRDFKRYSTVRVTNIDNGKSVDCFINDYGPELGQVPERHIDLSSHAFKQISDLELGLINVKVEEL